MEFLLLVKALSLTSATNKCLASTGERYVQKVLSSVVGVIVRDTLQGDICPSVARDHGVRIFGSGLVQVPDPNVCRLLTCNFKEGDFSNRLFQNINFFLKFSKLDKIFKALCFKKLKRCDEMALFSNSRSDMLVQFGSNCFIAQSFSSTQWCCYCVLI